MISVPIKMLLISGETDALQFSRSDEVSEDTAQNTVSAHHSEQSMCRALTCSQTTETRKSRGLRLTFDDHCKRGTGQIVWPFVIVLVVFSSAKLCHGANGQIPAIKSPLQQQPPKPQSRTVKQGRAESSSSLFADVEDLSDSTIRTRLGRINIEHLGDSPNDFDRLIERMSSSPVSWTTPHPLTQLVTHILKDNGQLKQFAQAHESKVSADPNNRTTMSFFQNNRTFASIVYTNPVQNSVRQPRRLINCHLVDLERHSSDVALYEAKYEIKTKHVEFKDMMQLIEACTNIARVHRRSGPGQEMMSYDTGDLLSIWRGIMPGTNWCGMGDRATSYNDLGLESDIDICCRAHDFCPIRLSAFSSGYGLFNWSFYTRSHCWCDHNFLDCLQHAESPMASVVTRIYFKIMKTSCLNDTSTYLAPTMSESSSNGSRILR